MGGSLERFNEIPPHSEWPDWVQHVVDLAWGAGYLDGEGYFATPGRGVQGIINTDSIVPNSIYHLRDIFGGSAKPYPGSKRNRFRWALGGDAARELARLFLDTGPHGLLWVKQPQALAVALAKIFPAHTEQGQLLRRRAAEHRQTEYPLEMKHEDKVAG